MSDRLYWHLIRTYEIHKDYNGVRIPRSRIHCDCPEGRKCAAEMLEFFLRTNGISEFSTPHTMFSWSVGHDQPFVMWIVAGGELAEGEQIKVLGHGDSVEPILLSGPRASTQWIDVSETFSPPPIGHPVELIFLISRDGNRDLTVASSQP